MTSEQLVGALKTVPFQAFAIRMADGSSYRIADPMYIAYRKNERTAAVYDEGGVIRVVDMRLMTELIFEAPLSLQA